MHAWRQKLANRISSEFRFFSSFFSFKKWSSSRRSKIVEYWHEHHRWHSNKRCHHLEAFATITIQHERTSEFQTNWPEIIISIARDWNCGGQEATRFAVIAFKFAATYFSQFMNMYDCMRYERPVKIANCIKSKRQNVIVYLYPVTAPRPVQFAAWINKNTFPWSLSRSNVVHASMPPSHTDPTCYYYYKMEMHTMAHSWINLYGFFAAATATGKGIEKWAPDSRV